MALFGKSRNFSVGGSLHKELVKNQINKVLSFLTRSEKPLSIKEIKIVFPDITSRTLQRRLLAMSEKGLVQRLGKGAATRYGLVDPQVLTKKVEGLAYVEDLTEYLSRPLIKRRPVSYQSEFINSYMPNSTSYLSTTICEELMESG